MRVGPWSSGISVIIRRETKACSLSVHDEKRGHVSTQQDGGHLQTKRRGLRMKHTYFAHWFWTSQPPELWEINLCCLSHPIDDIFMAAREDWNTTQWTPGQTLKVLRKRLTLVADWELRQCNVSELFSCRNSVARELALTLLGWQRSLNLEYSFISSH